MYREKKGMRKKALINVYREKRWDWIKSSNYYVYNEKKTLSKKTLTIVCIGKSRD